MLKRVVLLSSIFTIFLSLSLSFAEEKQGIIGKVVSASASLLTGPLSIIKSSVSKEAKSAAPTPAIKAEAKHISPVPAAAPRVVPPKKTYTKEEMVTYLKETLDDEEEILSFIPGLKKAITEKGESSYTYEGLKLEDLDKDKLSKIFVRVRQEATRIRTDRLNRQLENIRRVDQLTKAAAGAAPKVPSLPPVIPQAVRVPNTPPQVPKIPAPPPTPPKR